MKKINYIISAGIILSLVATIMVVSDFSSRISGKSNTAAFDFWGVFSPKSSEKDILAYYYRSPVYSDGTFRKDYNIIYINIPYNIPSDKIFPIIKVSPGATISPSSLTQVDVNHAIEYTVFAEDGSSKKYKVVFIGVPAITIPIDILNCQDLQNMERNLYANYVLMSNIDCSGINFRPIGGGNPFVGTLKNGGEYTIKGLTIQNSAFNYSYAGLFGVLSGTVQDIHIIDGNINGWS
ncbi:DUF5018 domain-containing protein, partial [Candidatus Dojkabacteria bacterium]|nr:DUF5018 domain-containing protein [Candidatus Dojkabacteria bacterium]